MRILVKIGSALISQRTRLDYQWLRGKVAELAAMQNQGHQLVLVSSGAVAAGMEVRRLSARPQDPLELQLLSGIGQVRLMRFYKDYFHSHGLTIAQMLLTHYNFDTPKEVRTIIQLCNAYLKLSVVPIVNENDQVNKEELDRRGHFPDNDILAALLAIGLQPDLAVILTDVDGLFAQDPKHNGDAELIGHVDQVDDSIKRMASHQTNRVGLGGMASKVTAAQMMTARGINVVVGNGRRPFADIVSGACLRTFFPGAGRP